MKFLEPLGVIFNLWMIVMFDLILIIRTYANIRNFKVIGRIAVKLQQVVTDLVYVLLECFSNYNVKDIAKGILY